MSQASSLVEGLIQRQLENAHLPPLWQVIYNEAIRGNHILFRRQDVLDFEGQSTTPMDLSDESQSNAIQRVVVQLIGCPDLTSMANIIDSLSMEFRARIYVFYKRMIDSWSGHLKVVLN